jgi:four helix bundle protein
MPSKKRAPERVDNKEFAVRIIRLSTRLPNTPEARVVRYQMTKAGTSVGANYREANRASPLFL